MQKTRGLGASQKPLSLRALPQKLNGIGDHQETSLQDAQEANAAQVARA